MNLVRFNHPGFTNFFDNFEKAHQGLTTGSEGKVPSVNILENDNSFVLEVAAPGIKKDEFKINLDNQVLTVSREVEESNEENAVNYTRKEFVYGNFSHSFTLPKSIKFDAITADYNEGILSISIPKKEEDVKLTRKIEVA